MARIYELSKKLGISNKELLAFLEEHGITLASIAVVTPEALALVEKHFEKKTPEKKIKSVKKNEVKQTAESRFKQQTPERKERVAPEPEIEVETELELVPMTLADVALKMKKPVNELILVLLKQGIAIAKNQFLSEKELRKLAQLFDIKIIEKEKKEAIGEPSLKETVAEGDWQERLPVVVVIGHVDHGKTTLLDFIRKTRVAAREKGGITQHLGAYEAKTEYGDIVFLDTPGHEAFSLLRVRGIRVADIAILVVAADDGVMPQTVEAIKRAQDAEIPLIVALNKMDKAAPSQIEVVKRQLTQYNLVPEEWGGQTVCIPISAKLGQGIDELLEVVALQAQLLDLKANLSLPARGYVLESKVEKGRGPVGTVICHHGTLKVGDFFGAGNTWGKVTSLVDSYGRRIKEVPPSMPVQVAGFTDLPQAGDVFEVTTQEAIKKGLVLPRTRLDAAFAKKEGETELNLVIKADNASSREALVNALAKLKSDHRRCTIIHSGVGDISESDVTLAADTGSIIYGFHVKVEPNALGLVRKKGVQIKKFDIIYRLLEDAESLLKAGAPVKKVTKKIGEAVVLKVFDIKKLGIVAGALVKSGRFVRDGKVTIYRGKQVIGEGTIKGLQRDKKAVKEVHTGFECAFLVDGFEDWAVDDRVECFQEVAE